jgi:hypothetical protein
MQRGKKIIVKMGAKKKNAGKKAGFKNYLVACNFNLTPLKSMAHLSCNSQTSKVDFWVKISGF